MALKGGPSDRGFPGQTGMGDELLGRILLGAGGGFPLLVQKKEPHRLKLGGGGAAAPQRRPEFTLTSEVPFQTLRSWKGTLKCSDRQTDRNLNIYLLKMSVNGISEG